MNFYQTAVQQSLMRRSAFIGVIIALTIQALILYYLERLRKEKCECALTKEYSILRTLILIIISYNVLIFLLLLLIQSGWLAMSLATTAAILSVVGPIMTIINLIFMILSLKYILTLYKVSCQCSDNGFRLMYLIYVVFSLGMLALGILMFLFVIVLALSIAANYKPKK